MTASSSVQTRVHRRSGRRSSLARVLAGAIVIVGSVCTIFPFVWAFTQSMQTIRTAFKIPPSWWASDVGFQNYHRVFELVPFGRQILNSIVVTGSIIVGSLVVAVLAAFPLARMRFKGRSAVFGFFLAAIMIPPQVTVIPIYLLLRYLGLIDSLGGLIVPALVQVVAIFLLRQHFMTIPMELTEAALIDGASHMRILWSVMLPSTGPTMAALAMYIGQQYWNDFFWPNILITSPSNMTLPIGLYSLNSQYTQGPPGVVFGAIMMITIPMLVLLLFSQRKFTEGISMVGASR